MATKPKVTTVKLGPKDCAIVLRNKEQEVEFLISEHLTEDDPTYLMTSLFLKLFESEEAMTYVMNIEDEEGDDTFDNMKAEKVWH